MQPFDGGLLLPEQMNARPALVFLAAGTHLTHDRTAIRGEHPEFVIGLDFGRQALEALAQIFRQVEMDFLAVIQAFDLKRGAGARLGEGERGFGPIVVVREKGGWFSDMLFERSGVTSGGRQLTEQRGEKGIVGGRRAAKGLTERFRACARFDGFAKGDFLVLGRV